MNKLFVIDIENMNAAPRTFIRGSRDPNFLVKEYGDENLLLRDEDLLKIIQWQMLKKNDESSIFNSSDLLWLNGYQYSLNLGISPCQNRADVINYFYSKREGSTMIYPHIPKKKFNIEIAGSTKIRLVFIPVDPDTDMINKYCQDVFFMNQKSKDRFMELHNERVKGDISMEEYTERTNKEMEFTEKFNYNS